MNPQYITMIIPARWYNQKGKSKKIREWKTHMINSNHIKEMHDFINSDDCFPKNVAIGGGICYFLWSRNYNGECDFYEHKKDQNLNDNITYSKRFLHNKYSDGIIRYSTAISILDKINLKIENSFEKLVMAQEPFGLGSNFSQFLYKKLGNSYKLINNKDKKDKDKKDLDVYVDEKFITKNKELINKYKIFISLNYGSGVLGAAPYSVLNGDQILIGEPNSCCTETYLAIGGFNSLEETNNAISYMKTKFFRFLIMMRVVDKSFTPHYFTLIPIQNWNEKWADEKLYKKYNLSQEEINFIESMITKL